MSQAGADHRQVGELLQDGGAAERSGVSPSLRSNSTTITASGRTCCTPALKVSRERSRGPINSTSPTSQNLVPTLAEQMFRANQQDTPCGGLHSIYLLHSLSHPGKKKSSKEIRGMKNEGYSVGAVAAA